MHKLILIIFLFSIFGVFSQSIENVDFRAQGKTIVVTYDFFHPKADTAINVDLVFKDQQGVVLTPKTTSGDIKNVKPGESKRIVWDVLSDSISLSGKYKAELNIIDINSVKIGNQLWMTENLNVDHFRNGDIIPEAKTAKEWKKAGKKKRPAWCYYYNDPANGDKYGKLYNWNAVNDTRGIAPAGWHVAKDADWTIFSDFLGGDVVAGTKMRSSTGWKENVEGYNVNGFKALPCGNRYANGQFYEEGSHAYWWSASECNESRAWCRILRYHYYYPLYQEMDLKFLREMDFKYNGFSVRCLKD